MVVLMSAQYTSISVRPNGGIACGKCRMVCSASLVKEVHSVGCTGCVCSAILPKLCCLQCSDILSLLHLPPRLGNAEAQFSCALSATRKMDRHVSRSRSRLTARVPIFRVDQDETLISVNIGVGSCALHAHATHGCRGFLRRVQTYNNHKITTNYNPPELIPVSCELCEKAWHLTNV